MKFGISTVAKRNATGMPTSTLLVALDSAIIKRERIAAQRAVKPFAPLRSTCHGTVFAAGSLQGPLLLSAPMARTRTHILAPLVKVFRWMLDLVLTSLNAQLLAVTGSTLVCNSSLAAPRTGPQFASN